MRGYHYPSELRHHDLQMAMIHQIETSLVMPGAADFAQ